MQGSAAYILSQKEIAKITTGISGITNTGSQLIFSLNGGGALNVTLTGLSDNNFTNILKTKLDSINTAVINLLTYTNGKVYFNGEELVTHSHLDLNYYTKDEMNEKLNAITLNGVDIESIADGKSLNKVSTAHMIQLYNYESANADSVLVKGSANLIYVSIEKNSANSYTKIASKEYVDQAIQGGVVLQDTFYNATTNTPDLTTIITGEKAFMWIVDIEGTQTLGGKSITFKSMDWIIKTKGGAYLHLDNNKVSAAWGNIGGDITTQIDLKDALIKKVEITRKINNKELSSDITLKLSDILTPKIITTTGNLTLDLNCSYDIASSLAKGSVYTLPSGTSDRDIIEVVISTNGFGLSNNISIIGNINNVTDKIITHNNSNCTIYQFKWSTTSMSWVMQTVKASIDINEVIIPIVNALYPIGHILMTENPLNPYDYLGVGTWVAYGQGRVPLGIDTSQTEFNTIGQIGGAKTHTLTIPELPKHSHPYVDRGNGAFNRGDFGSNTDVADNTNGNYTTGLTGGDGSHNNLQPYIVCYMWKRTS